MISITVKFLAGVGETLGLSNTIVEMPADTTLVELIPRLEVLGIDTERKDLIIVLNGRGINQWPADRRFVKGDEVAILPLITGG